jgi:hypothetical protein
MTNDGLSMVVDKTSGARQKRVQAGLRSVKA